MHIFHIVDGEPHEAPVAVKFYIAYTWAFEELLGDPVIEPFPFDIDGHDAIIACLIFNFRIFNRDIIKIIFAVFFLHIFLPDDRKKQPAGAGCIFHFFIRFYFLSFFMQRVYR